MTFINWKMIAEPRSYILRWRSRFRRRRICFSFLLVKAGSKINFFWGAGGNFM